MLPKENIIKQVIKIHIKKQNKKLVVKGEDIAKKLNNKYFLCNKTEHQATNCKSRTQQENPKKKRLLKFNITEVDHLINKVLKINLSMLFMKSTSLTSPYRDGGYL